MAIAKIILNGVTQMDLTSDTVTAADIFSPKTAHAKDGTPLTGSASLTTKSVTANGTYNASSDNASGYSSVTVNVSGSSGMNIQAALGMVTKANQAYEATDLSIKVAKTGTYTVSWDGCRSSTSGTNGSRIYINGTAQTAYTTFDATNTRFQHVEMTNVSLTANDVVTLWCRARGTSYYMTVANLIIKQTA